MERCPNCGAPARPNAKFCTTCGYRLPDQVGATNGEATAASEPKPEAAAATGLGDAEAGSSQPSGDDPDAAWRPSESGSQDDTETASGSVAADEGPVAEGPADEVIESTWSTPPGSDPPWMNAWTTGTFASEASTSETGSPVPAATEDAVDADADVALVEAEVEEGAVVEEEGELIGASANPLVVPADDDLPPHLASVDRALALLDELRVLVPSLAAGPDGRNHLAGGAALADALEAAIEFDQALDVGNLRDAMERARERPKDIDTVLDLAGRVEAVIALVDTHNRLRAAAQGAVDVLRGAGE